MSFSNTAFNQREKESKALRSFLTLSLIGSLGIHVGVLASGIGNYLTRAPEVSEDPIEFAVVDTPSEKPKEEPLEKPKETAKLEQDTKVLTSSASKPSTEGIVSNNTKIEPQTKIESPSVPKPVPIPIPVPQRQTVVPPQPTQRIVEEAKVVQPEKIQPKVERATTQNTNEERPTQPRQVASSNSNPVRTNTNTSSQSTNTPSQNNNSDALRETLRGVRDSRSQSVASSAEGSGTPGNGDTGTRGSGAPGGTTALTGSGTGITSSTGTGGGNGGTGGSGGTGTTGAGTSGSGGSSTTGSGLGRTGNGSGAGIALNPGDGCTGTRNSEGNGRQRVATAPTTPKLPSNSGDDDNSRRSGDGRAACRPAHRG